MQAQSKGCFKQSRGPKDLRSSKRHFTSDEVTPERSPETHGYKNKGSLICNLVNGKKYDGDYPGAE